MCIAKFSFLLFVLYICCSSPNKGLVASGSDSTLNDNSVSVLNGIVHTTPTKDGVALPKIIRIQSRRTIPGDCGIIGFVFLCVLFCLFLFFEFCCCIEGNQDKPTPVTINGRVIQNGPEGLNKAIPLPYYPLQSSTQTTQQINE